MKAQLLRITIIYDFDKDGNRPQLGDIDFCKYLSTSNVDVDN